MNQFFTTLTELGFVPHDHLDHFGYEIPYVDYLYACKEGRHIYVSLVHTHDDRRFLEAVYEEYLTKKNTRVKGKNNTPKAGEYSEFQKKGFLPIKSNIFRDLNELLAAIN